MNEPATLTRIYELFDLAVKALADANHDRKRGTDGPVISDVDLTEMEHAVGRFAQMIPTLQDLAVEQAIRERRRRASGE